MQRVPADGFTLEQFQLLHSMVLCCALLFAPVCLADSPDTAIRLSVATRLFPSLLAADMELEKKAGANDRLLILVVYKYDRAMAETAARVIGSVGKIRKMEVDVQLIPVEGMTAYKGKATAGIFIGDNLEESLDYVIGYARERKVITFSPYPGDVERGVAGGIQVRDRILPYINLKTLRESSINLRPFYLKVAETYDPK